MSGLRGDAVIAGVAEWKAERPFSGPPRFDIEQWAELAALALADAGLPPDSVNGLACTAIRESEMFGPATIAEYLGWQVNYAEHVDLGGATAAGMVWRAAAAIELGLCDVVVCAIPARPRPPSPAPRARSNRAQFGATSPLWGSPQAEFEIPFGNVGQNCGYAMIAERYAAEFGYDERALAYIVVAARANAASNADAIFQGKPLTVDDVLASKLVAGRLHMLEIVMPCSGGAAVVVTSREVAAECPHRPVHVTGFGEHVAFKTPTFAESLVRTPIAVASAKAFSMAGLSPDAIDAIQVYDCYTITVLLALEDAGFCAKGEGMDFVSQHDFTWRGDKPLNTNGGQLGFGQAGMAGGFTHVVEAVRQIRGKAPDRQVPGCDKVFVAGNGGIMSEHAVLILEGA